MTWRRIMARIDSGRLSQPGVTTPRPEASGAIWGHHTNERDCPQCHGKNSIEL